MYQAKWGAGVSLGSCFRNAEAQFARPSRQRLKITSANLLDFRRIGRSHKLIPVLTVIRDGLVQQRVRGVALFEVVSRHGLRLKRGLQFLEENTKRIIRRCHKSLVRERENLTVKLGFQKQKLTCDISIELCEICRRLIQPIIRFLPLMTSSLGNL